MSLSCQVCKLSYDSELRIPLFLVCGHTHCKLCLSEILKEKSFLVCPIDNKRIFSTIDSLTKNHIILKKIKDQSFRTTKDKIDSKSGAQNLRKNITFDGRMNPNSIETLVNYDFENTEVSEKKERKMSLENKNQIFEKDEFRKSLILESEQFSIDKKAVKNLEFNPKIEFSPTKSPIKEKKEVLNQQNDETYEENMIFSYYKVMANIVKIFDFENEEEQIVHIDIPGQTLVNEEDENDKNPNSQKKYPSYLKALKYVAIFMVIILNYLLSLNENFFRIFIFIILVNDTKKSMKLKDLHKKSICLKRWMTLCFILILDDFIGVPSNKLLGFIDIKNIWNCSLIIYILIVTGPTGGLNYVFKKIIRGMNRLDLLIKK